LDVFRYQVSTAQLSNLTRSGTASAAPWGPGKLEVDLSWLSLTWRQVNIVAGEPTAKQIYTVDTKTYAVVNVMPNHQINAATLREDLRGAPRSPLVFLIARPMNSGPLFEENVFVYNSDTASPIKQLSHWLHGSASVELNNLMPAANARHVAYTKGDGANEVLYVAPADASQKPWALNGNGSYLSPAFAWSPDGAYLVFGSGNSASSRDLWRAPATGGTLTKLRSTQAQTIHIFQVR
ncbi:MAG: hypothetical protein H6707_12345, partial [Deltaproteobacteria bacterium]|nr:hypothetical protein [Deltaproteobacteria bacterium]